MPPDLNDASRSDFRIRCQIQTHKAVFSGGIRLKYECVYLYAFETGSELRVGLSHWIDYYNARRPHSTLAGRTPNEAYGANETERLAA